jgi:aryl-alcohol dehydrogenase-like predicted oxidoreductase
MLLPAAAGERSPRRIGLGLAALGRPGYLNLGHGDDLGADRSPAALRERSFAVLDAAYAGGVRYLDAARSYGRAEEFLGAWLRDRDPAGVVVGSKWGYVYTAGWRVDADPPEIKHHDVETFRRQLAETREQLGDRRGLYQIHSATPESGVLEDAAVLRALAELRTAGTAIGLTASGVSQPQTIERAVALAAVLVQPFADVVLSGASTPAALASNLAAATLDLPDDARAALDALEEDSASYWRARSELAWT